MMNINEFTNVEFGTITALDIDGESWFIGKEIAEILGYTNSRKALKDHVDMEDKQVILKSRFVTLDESHHMTIPNRGLTCINESGLYSLILSSKLSSAKMFKRWITTEVLPAIRKHGAYLTSETIEQVLYNPDTIIKIATALKEEQKKNAELTATNAILTEQTNKYNVRDAINALIRKYASSVCNDNFAKAWNIFYKKLNYTLHINIKSRKFKSGVHSSLLDLLSESEIKTAARVATAMCEAAGVNTGNIIINY